jgi:hypothetical protein
MNILYRLILNIIVLIGMLVGLHIALITIGSTLAPVTDHFKTLTMIYAGILDGEFTSIALVVAVGAASLITLANLLIGE